MRLLDPVRAALSLVLLEVLLLGCSSAPREAPGGTRAAAPGERAAIVGDRDLAAKFVLLDIQREERDGRLLVQFDLKNTTPGELAIEWVVQWKDANGIDIHTDPDWQPARVGGQGLHSMQLLAPTPEAAVFQLQFRKPGSR